MRTQNRLRSEIPHFLGISFALTEHTALGYGLFQIGIRSVSATVASIVTMCEPFTAAILAWILFHEELGPFGLIGACLLLGAMAIIMLVPGKHIA
jgi:drug/metabolite transporter, DME family